MADYEPSPLEREIDEFAEIQANQHASESAAAKREHGRYAVAGAAGGIALLVGQFGNASENQQFLLALGILFFLLSLYCSFNTLRAIWVEEAENAASWKKWGTKARQRMFEARTQRLQDVDTVVLPDNPAIQAEQFARWSGWAVGLLTQGAIWSIFYLASFFSWNPLSPDGRTPNLAPPPAIVESAPAQEVGPDTQPDGR